MTESEWLACTDPEKMLGFLPHEAGSRKFRLFGVACCRRVWHLLPDELFRAAVTVAERYADGLASSQETFAAGEAAQAGWEASYGAVNSMLHGRASEAAMAYAATVTTALWAPARWCTSEAARRVRQCDVVDKGQEQASQTAFLRCIFGNPFRPVTIDPSWLSWHDGLLVSMARQMYDSRDFSDMPVLADALEEAGCRDQDILGHCRSGGEHVRGGWVVDLLLGKS